MSEPLFKKRGIRSHHDGFEALLSLIQAPYQHGMLDVPSVRNGAQQVHIVCNIFFLPKLDVSIISKHLDIFI